MARQRMSEKKTRRLAERTGLPVKYAMTRGNTDHRIDLYLKDGTIARLYRDGEIEQTSDTWAMQKQEG